MAVRTFSATGASISAVTLGSAVPVDSFTGVRSRLASVPTIAVRAASLSSAIPERSGTTTVRSPISRIAASR